MINYSQFTIQHSKFTINEGIKMEIKAREQQFQTLRQAFAAGQIDQAAFNTAVDQLGFQDGWGRYWAIGIQSGAWYFFNGQQWRQADPGQAEQLPFLDVRGRCWQRSQEDEAWYYFQPETGQWVKSNQQESLVSFPLPEPAARQELGRAKPIVLIVGLVCAFILAWLIVLPMSSASPGIGPLPEPSPRPPLDGDGGNGGSGGGQADRDSSRDSASPSSAIFGQVVDVSSGRPAAGLEVEVSGQIVRTDTDGSYSITGLHAGEYVVSPRLAGEATSLQGPVYVNVDGIHNVQVDLSYASEVFPPPAIQATPVVLVQPSVATAPPGLPASGADLSGIPPLIFSIGLLLIVIGGATQLWPKVLT